MKISEADIMTLEEKYIPNIREMMKSSSVNDVLDTIDDMIVDDILDNNDEPSNVGRELQLIYDRIERYN